MVNSIRISLTSKFCVWLFSEDNLVWNIKVPAMIVATQGLSLQIRTGRLTRKVQT